MIRNFVRLAAALVASIAMAEFVVRLLPSERLGFQYRNERFLPPQEFQIDSEANRFGAHDVEHGRAPDDVRRVLLLGDSFVQALSVPIDQTVARRLAHHLEKTLPGAYEVAALGGTGYHPYKELKFLKRHGEALDPSLVVTLFYVGNDVTQLMAAAARLQLVRQGALPANFHLARFGAEDARYLVLPGSALNRLISHRITLAERKRSAHGVPINFLVFQSPPEPAVERGWQVVERALLETREEAARLGADYAVVSASTPFGVLGKRGLARLRDSYPSMREGEWDLDLPDRRLEEIAASHGIPFLALQPLLRRETEAGGPSLHWRYDGHWNAAGNDRAGALIAEFVLDLDGAEGGRGTVTR